DRRSLLAASPLAEGPAPARHPGAIRFQRRGVALDYGVPALERGQLGITSVIPKSRRLFVTRRGLAVGAGRLLVNAGLSHSSEELTPTRRRPSRISRPGGFTTIWAKGCRSTKAAAYISLGEGDLLFAGA